LSVEAGTATAPPAFTLSVVVGCPEGRIDLRGFLGLSSDVPKGFTDIRVRDIRINFRSQSDVDNLERLERLMHSSPVFDTNIQDANVNIQVESK
jgi:hypothetical protein